MLFSIREKSHRANVCFSVFFFYFCSVLFSSLQSRQLRARKTQFYPRTKRMRLCIGMRMFVAFVVCFFLLLLFLVFHSRGRYITFDAVKLESIFHCTRIYFRVLFSQERTQSVLSMNVAEREKGERGKTNLPHTKLHTVIFSLCVLYTEKLVCRACVVCHETEFNFKLPYLL